MKVNDIKNETKTAFRRGLRVTIYQDPITQKKAEGEADLLRHISTDTESGMERWRVQFLSDLFICDRNIMRPASK